MLLPEINVPVSTDIFASHVLYFIQRYATSDHVNLCYEKNDFLSGGCRFSVFYNLNGPKNSSSNKIGDIDLLTVHLQKVNIKASVLNLEKIKEGIGFFDKFYWMIFENWGETPYYDSVYVDGKKVVNETLFRIASSTGIVSMFFSINRILDRIPSSGHKDLMEFSYLLIGDTTFSQQNPEYKETIHQYQLEISKGLPDFLQVESATKKAKRGVHPKTMKRAERIKKIKDDKPYLSQSLTVSEYNEMYEGDDFITKYDLQNAYNALGWKWKRGDRSY